MQVFLLAFFGLLLITSIMAVGVLMGRKPISGSCGGIGAALGEKDYVCEFCGDDEAKCEELNASNTRRPKGQADKSRFYDAS